MPNLFGLNIADIINSEIASAGGVLPGILTRTVPGTRTGGSLTAGTNPTETTHPFKGFAETKADRRSGQIGAQSMATVTILGASLSVAPEVNDSVLLDGVTYVLMELLSRDPAAAVFQFRAEA